MTAAKGPKTMRNHLFQASTPNPTISSSHRIHTEPPSVFASLHSVQDMCKNQVYTASNIIQNQKSSVNKVKVGLAGLADILYPTRWIPRALAHWCSSHAILLVLMECRWPIAAALAAAVIAAADIAAVVAVAAPAGMTTASRTPACRSCAATLPLMPWS